jgi:hypothetical protein
MIHCPALVTLFRMSGERERETERETKNNGRLRKCGVGGGGVTFSKDHIRRNDGYVLNMQSGLRKSICSSEKVLSSAPKMFEECGCGENLREWFGCGK